MMYKRILSVLCLFILLLLHLPIWAAAELSDVSAEFPLIPSFDLAGYSDDIPSRLRSQGLFIGTFDSTDEGLFLGQQTDPTAFSVVFRVANFFYVVTKNTTGTIYRTTDTVTGYRASSISSFDPPISGWSYKAFGLGDITYSPSVPNFSSRDKGLERISELEALVPEPDHATVLIDLLTRTNELLAGLYLCIGVLVGVNLMSVLWRQVT